VATILAITLIVSPGFGLSAAASPGAGLVGALDIATDPAGASVYVDGTLVGRTPLTINTLSVGDHRLRLSKPGYLDNSRTVRIEAEQIRPVVVRLTADLSAPAAVSASAAAPGDSIFANKWFWVGVAGGGAAAAFLALSGGNTAPTLSGILASPTIGLAGSSTITFTAQASDPDGDSLSYSWDFGSGAPMSTSANPTVVFNNAGTFDVRLSVSDGSSSVSANTTVTIRSMTATWTESDLFGGTYVLTQSGTSITGTYSDFDGPGTVSGSVSTTSPRVILTVTQPQFDPFTFTGDPNGDVNQVNMFVGGVFAFTLRRQ
jgi:hypothetical protein